MTLHIVLPTAEPNTLVWVSDTLLSVGFAGRANHDKICYLETHQVACSAWGNYALLLRNQLVDRIERGGFNLSNRDTILDSLQRFSIEMIPTYRIDTSKPRSESPGLILTTFFDGHPHVYFSIVSIPPIAEQVENLICIGDEDNPARVFVEHYYELSGKTFVETLSLAIHAIRVAHRIKASYIGDPNAWVFQNGIFKGLPKKQLAGYIAASNALDAAILSNALIRPG